MKKPYPKTKTTEQTSTSQNPNPQTSQYFPDEIAVNLFSNCIFWCELRKAISDFDCLPSGTT